MVDELTKAILEVDLIDGIKHGVCVSNLTYLIAKKLGLSDEECYNLAVAGMVHDIGKHRLSSYLETVDFVCPHYVGASLRKRGPAA